MTTPAPQPETAPPDSRRGFLRVAGAGGVAAAALLLAACGDDDGASSTASTATAGSSADAGSADGDLKILNYALTLEHLEADFYAAVVDAGVLEGAEQEIAKRFGESERQHVEALIATVKKLGGTPVERPKSTFPVEERKAVLELAATVENLGAAAYLGKAGEIQSPEVLAAALSIHSVEARHAAALNHLLGKPSTPDGAFAKAADERTVLAAVKPFLVA
ncbi:Twin-arginine translocation pathway signal [Patulibacter medicamentivorans]|uniref:Twin-arginine translocation pathway signal n=1 Tax=Patulibacter medicamentivorans TaxID=1097667 RepID=H0EAK5_9ACTN|nr:ferritin-like domain-containing protein [Patulibacter medicamentivorans]EHN09332.1 Twin-arginine translocation pathway signal [Patulibacter medicamentivorans]